MKQRSGMLSGFRAKLDALLFNRPAVLHGEVASWVGCSLETCAREIEPYLEDGTLRVLSPAECLVRGWHWRALAYCRA
jgi:hypothetical protein